LCPDDFLRAASVSVSHTVNYVKGFGQSTPPQNRQLFILISDGKQKFDHFVRELKFQNYLINALCEMRAPAMNVGVREMVRYSPVNSQTISGPMLFCTV